VIQVNPRLH